VRFANDPVSNYLATAPLALALERGLECRLLSKQEFVAPVLDLGCGDGLLAKNLFADKIDTGVDPNANEIACAAKTGSYHELICCVGSEVPKPSGVYRTIFANSVLEHIPNLGPVLLEAHRLLQIGGSFLLTVPTDEFEQYSVLHRILVRLGLTGCAARFRSRYNRFWRHYHAYSAPEWRRIVTEAGFEVLEMIRYNPPGMTTRNDCLTPLAVLSTILKLVSGRWVIWPKLRAAFFAPVARKIWRSFDERGVSPDGSLLFIEARKVLKNAP
jgi:SAM-dependent methyltransferase